MIVNQYKSIIHYVTVCVLCCRSYAIKAQSICLQAAFSSSFLLLCRILWRNIGQKRLHSFKSCGTGMVCFSTVACGMSSILSSSTMVFSVLIMNNLGMPTSLLYTMLSLVKPFLTATYVNMCFGGLPVVAASMHLSQLTS